MTEYLGQHFVLFSVDSGDFDVYSGVCVAGVAGGFVDQFTEKMDDQLAACRGPAARHLNTRPNTSLIYGH